MIVKIGNQSFDTRNVPIALVLSDQDLKNIQGIMPKGDGENSLYLRAPSDISPDTLLAWAVEACPEFKTSFLKQGVFYSVGDKIKS